jgi:hypothetical protein
MLPHRVKVPSPDENNQAGDEFYYTKFRGVKLEG